MAPAIRLKVGDKVSVKGLDAFNIDWLRTNYARNWQNVRFDGVVGALVDGKWQIDFDDGETQTLTRNKVRYESRPASSGLLADTLVEVASSDDEDGADAAETPAVYDDSSDEPSDDERAPHPPFEAEHERVGGAHVPATMEGWVRDDGFPFDQRAKAGFDDDNGPKLRNFPDFQDAGLFQFALHFLPVGFMSELADTMTAAAKRKFEMDGDANCRNFQVTLDDVYQWIGVWIYILAFPQAGDVRDTYWKEPAGGYGPRHRLADILRLGGNGDKTQFWFRRMQTVLEFPHKPGSPSSDPFIRVRHFWDSLRKASLLCCC